jgi:integrase
MTALATTGQQSAPSALRSLALPNWAALMALADALVARSAGRYQGWGDAVIFEAYTAARIGEASGCLVRDVNTEDWIWTVRRQTTPSPGELGAGRTTASGGGLVDKNTKGRRARQVPLIDAIRDLVQRRINLAGGNPDARLFTGPRGGRITTATLRDASPTTAKRASDITKDAVPAGYQALGTRGISAAMRSMSAVYRPASGSLPGLPLLTRPAASPRSGSAQIATLTNPR